MKITINDQSAMIESGYQSISHLAEDRISTLPDDILVSILSLMMKGDKGDIERVVRTSLLSRSWRFLWKHSLKSLAFTFKEHDHVFPEVQYAVFVDRVNHILSLRDTIDDFSLTFKKRYRSDDHLRGWIESALKKRVKQIIIKLDNYGRGFTLDNKVIRNHNMDSLVSLCLKELEVTGEFLEYLLTICGSLEHLSITASYTLVDFTVSGPGLKLKYLKIFYCWNLKHLYIRDVNLVSLEFCDRRSCSTVVIENTPHLVNARIVYRENTEKILSYLPQLETLVLEFNIGMVKRPALNFPKLWNVVRLELVLDRQDFSCAVIASLLFSCPSIRGLKLVYEDLRDRDVEDKETEKLELPHECLKVLEIVGFIGCKHDTGVALYIIENTVSLDKVVVDTSHTYRSSYNDTWRDEESETREKARARAKENLGTRLLHTSTKFVLK